MLVMPCSSIWEFPEFDIEKSSKKDIPCTSLYYFEDVTLLIIYVIHFLPFSKSVWYLNLYFLFYFLFFF